MLIRSVADTTRNSFSPVKPFAIRIQNWRLAAVGIRVRIQMDIASGGEQIVISRCDRRWELVVGVVI